MLHSVLSAIDLDRLKAYPSESRAVQAQVQEQQGRSVQVLERGVPERGVPACSVECRVLVLGRVDEAHKAQVQGREGVRGRRYSYLGDF